MLKGDQQDEMHGSKARLCGAGAVRVDRGREWEGERERKKETPEEGDSWDRARVGTRQTEIRRVINGKARE